MPTTAYGAEVFEFIEEPFNQVALAVQGEVRVSRFDAIGLRRNDWHDLPKFESIDQGVGIIRFVG
jgi:hypothetical protein